MSEYEVYWLTDFPLIIYWAHQEIIMVISQKKQAKKYKDIPTRISAGVGDHPCFLTFYTYDPYQL